MPLVKHSQERALSRRRLTWEVASFCIFTFSLPLLHLCFAAGTDVVKIRDYQELHKKHEPETGELVSLSMVSSPRLFIPGRKDDLQIATTHFTATQTKLPDGSLGVKVHDMALKTMM